MFCKEKVEKKIDVSKNVEGGGRDTPPSPFPLIQSLMVLYLSRAALLDRILDTVDEETNFINVDERNKQVEETSSHKGGRANNKNFSSEPYSLV